MAKEKRYRVMEGYHVTLGDGRSEKHYEGGDVFMSGPVEIGSRINGEGLNVPIMKSVEELYSNRIEVDTGRTKKVDEGEDPTVWMRVFDKDAQQRAKQNAAGHEERGRHIRDREDKQHQDRADRAAAIRAQGQKQAQGKHRMVESPTGG